MRSHGIEDPGPNGIHPRVTRISIRDGDGLKGQIASFYNVPGVFGSVLNQSVNHIGADCADVLMTAWSRWKKQKLTKNHNVQMMVTRFKKRAEFEMTGGSPQTPLVWGKDFEEGDFMAVRYGEGGKKYHHVGALWEDANGNGTLDGEDLLIHAGPDPLHLSRLKYGAFDGHVVILRP